MAADLVRGVIDYSANVIFGACIDENMSDEVEVVIIATGFNSPEPGITPEAQDFALRQATLLSQKIDMTYNNKSAMGQEQSFGYPQQPSYVNNGQYAQPAQNFGYVPQQPVQPMQQNSFAPMYAQQPVQPMPPVQPTAAEPQSFEPDDPIPNAEEEKTEKKRRPRFVDFFIKKNKQDK